jgi:DcmR-like sensory protein
VVISAHVNWLELDRSSHAVQFYSGENFLLDSGARFISTALGAGNSAMLISTQAHRDGIAERLKTLGVDADGAVRKGRYVTVDALQLLAQLVVDGQLSRTRFDEFLHQFMLPLRAAAESERQLVAVFGELVGMLWADGDPEAAIELEHFWNELSSQGSYCLRCLYPIASFSDPAQSELFTKLCAEHVGTIPPDSHLASAAEQNPLGNLATRVRQFENAA